MKNNSRTPCVPMFLNKALPRNTNSLNIIQIYSGVVSIALCASSAIHRSWTSNLFAELKGKTSIMLSFVP